MNATTSSKEQMEVLASDVKLLEASKIADGFIRYPASLMPDGEEFSGKLPDSGVNNNVLQMWCANVRSQYDARKEIQDDAEASRGEAARADRERQNPPARESGGVPTTEERSVPALEESLEAILTRRLELLVVKHGELDAKYDELVTESYHVRDMELEVAAEIKTIRGIINEDT